MSTPRIPKLPTKTTAAPIILCGRSRPRPIALVRENASGFTAAYIGNVSAPGAAAKDRTAWSAMKRLETGTL